jgi:hypothetical protein
LIAHHQLSGLPKSGDAARKRRKLVTPPRPICKIMSREQSIYLRPRGLNGGASEEITPGAHSILRPAQRTASGLIAYMKQEDLQACFAELSRRSFASPMFDTRVAKVVFRPFPIIDVDREAIPLNDLAAGITQRFAH